MSRHIALEGVDNFRDFGDYRGHDGAWLRRGHLYRSASHGRASDADLEVIAGLGLAVIVDLRRRNERERDPSRRHRGFAGQVIENPTGAESEDTWRAHISRSDLSVESFRDYMFDYYRAAPFEARHLDLFSRYFKALADSDGPVLIHCAAGKDRTGLLAALTHHLAGVHHDDIAADFLLTNDPVRLAKRLPMVTAVIAEIAGRTPQAEAVNTAMSVEAVYLDASFAAIGERFGGVDAYLEQALGVDRPLRDRLHAKLLD
jgi:protein tyrosine/serine phosphatase